MLHSLTSSRLIENMQFAYCFLSPLKTSSNSYICAVHNLWWFKIKFSLMKQVSVLFKINYLFLIMIYQINMVCDVVTLSKICLKYPSLKHYIYYTNLLNIMLSVAVMKTPWNRSVNIPSVEVTLDTQASWDEVTTFRQEEDSVTTPSVGMWCV